ncbi:MAG TPA: AAA family ATPase [Terriglobales bacterium]|nr:AAA family ATPase [Terriglobales bacterium]
MRDRIQRRKKTASEPSSQPAPPPLQPAYFDAEETPAERTPGRAPEPVATAGEAYETESAAQAVPQESSSIDAGEPSEQPRPQRSSSGRQATSGEGQRGRGRRRRGGRGRGGRGREQAVAQAFTPAAAKGIIPEIAVGTGEAVAELDETGTAEPAEPETEAAAPLAPQIPAAVPAVSARPPKGIVVLAIGLPGSGKSSWFKRHNLTPLSSDIMRSLLFDDIREQRFQDLVFSNLRSLLKARLIAKRPMNYVDATNLTPQERQHWIKLAKDYNYEVHAVFFDVPLEVCIERHQRRDRVVPEDVMRRMAAKLKPPSFDEGFAKITVVRVKKKD